MANLLKSGAGYVEAGNSITGTFAAMFGLFSLTLRQTVEPFLG